MELDAIQKQEFGQHWEGTYAVVDRDIVYVERAEPDTETFRGRKVTAWDRSERFPMQAIQAPRLKSGFYSLANQQAFVCSRLPAQHTKRGMSTRNTGMYMPSISRGVVVSKPFNWGHESLVAMDSQYLKGNRHTVDQLNNGYALVADRMISSFALTRDYAIARRVIRKSDGGESSHIAIINTELPIGRVNIARGGNLVFSFSPQVSYLVDAFKEEVNREFQTEIVTSV